MFFLSKTRNSRMIGHPKRISFKPPSNSRMTPSELFSTLDPALSESVFAFLYDGDRNAYRGAMNILASRRNLRPVFLEKKPRPERHQWMADALSRKRNDDLALEILQNWILRGNSAMVLQFLKDLGIEHDGEGIIEDTPVEPPPEVVDTAVGNLLANFPAGAVIVYLHLFASMDDDGWRHLRALLAGDPRLQPASSAAN